MESVLGFDDVEPTIEEISASSSSYGYKLVPWLSWDEWEELRESLFSSSPEKIAFALRRVSTWRSRGCLPVVIDVTASIIEIQQQDPFFSCRSEELKDGLHSEQMLAMLYCMAILRLVNCVVEKTRKQQEISIADAADMIGIPRVLIDVRHEGSHRDLPALVVVRDSSIMALDWLISYYWEPQRKQILFQKDDSSNIRNEIKSKLYELVYCLKAKTSPEDCSPPVKGKRSKKQITRTLKILASLYSSFSSEVVSLLLELSLEALDSSSLLELPKDSQAGKDLRTLWDDWKVVLKRLSSKEPELILALLQRVLNTIGIKEDIKYGTGGDVMALENKSEIFQVEQLSFLYLWLVVHLKELNLHQAKDHSGKSVLNTMLMELLRKTLLMSASGNIHLKHSALQLVQLVGNSFLMKKLTKLCSSGSSSTDAISEDSSLFSSYNQLNLQEESISDASKKLELIKLKVTKSKATEMSKENENRRWVVAKSWTPCPIGMLPRVLGSSGHRPRLDIENGSERVPTSLEKKNWELNQCSSKRKASSDISTLDEANPKKARETTEAYCDSDSKGLPSRSISGRLLIDTVWKQVGLEEIRSEKSAVRILV